MAVQIRRWALAAGAALYLSGAANAAPIVIFNTGVDTGGAVLPNGTTSDPHYTLTSVPGGSTETLVRTGETGFPIGPWLADDAVSRWIKPNNEAGPVCNLCSDPEGDYVYETTFDLQGFIASTAVLTGRWSADNRGEIFVNGSPSGMISPGGENWSSFTITRGFVDGLNLLEFRVQNDPGQGSPTGLRVEISATADPVPEPASIALLGGGLAGLTLLRRSRRRVRRARGWRETSSPHTATPRTASPRRSTNA
jgi:hypothetical protein